MSDGREIALGRGEALLTGDAWHTRDVRRKSAEGEWHLFCVVVQPSSRLCRRQGVRTESQGAVGPCNARSGAAAGNSVAPTLGKQPHLAKRRVICEKTVEKAPLSTVSPCFVHDKCRGNAVIAVGSRMTEDFSTREFRPAGRQIAKCGARTFVLWWWWWW